MSPALAALAAFLPDPNLTPGALNPAVTQATIAQTICVPGWTQTVRPPASFTTGLKRRQLPPGARLQAYEEDHLVSIELGGSPTDEANLWPEPWDGKWGAHTKDRLENELRRRVCSGRMTLDAAQDAIRTNWIEAYPRFVGKRP